MRIYRYYCDATDKFPNESILSRLGRIANLNPDEDYFKCRQVAKKFIDELPFPDNEIIRENIKCSIPMLFFITELANEKFRDSIDEIKEYLFEKDNIRVKYHIMNISPKSPRIIYKDEYQVVLHIFECGE